MVRRSYSAPRCPYCRQEDCTWTISPLAGPTGAEVRTACGQAVSVDALLGKARWHLEAAQRAVQISKPASAEGKEHH